MQIVRRGITRTVVLIGSYTVKFPSLRAYGRGVTGVLWSFTRGVQANISEKEWSGSPGTCPVRWSLFGLVSVYPRCRPIPKNTVVDYAAIGFLGPADKKTDNVGYLDGTLVFIDYDMSWNDCYAHQTMCGIGNPARCISRSEEQC